MILVEMKSEKRWDLIVLLVRDTLPTVCQYLPEEKGHWSTNHFLVRRRSVRSSMPAYYVQYILLLWYSSTEQCLCMYVHGIVKNHLFDHPSPNPNHWVILYRHMMTGRRWMTGGWTKNPLSPPAEKRTYMSRRIWRSMQGKAIKITVTQLLGIQD